MLGYMTRKQALAAGYTHHARYYGIPCWLALEGDGVAAEAKWRPLEVLMTAFHWIEGFLRQAMFPDDEPGFQFWLGKEIEP